MELWTIQMSKWRKAQKLGLPFTDTTVKGNIMSPFAPDWEFVKAYKDGLISEEEYTALYKDKMRRSYQARQAEWLSFLRQEKAAVSCFCTPGKFCHRILLVDILKKVAEHHHIPFHYAGEVE